MATGREGENGGLGDSAYGELDCNDNSPRLGYLQTQDGEVSDSSPHAMCHGGGGGGRKGGTRHGSTGNSSDVNTNSQMALIGGVGCGGITYSTEDTLNNDFFYDDEFTIPFDANITDALVENDYNNGTSQMIDSAEIDAIIKREKSRASKHLHNHRDALSTSKSDSCLYHADIEVSVGSEVCDQNMSQEMTPSEKDISSSDMSDNLHSGRLFSPPNETTSVNAASESDLNNSFLSAEGKFEFDWKATKDQYMISFDKNLAKYSSDESSFCEGTGSAPGRRVLTTWAIQRGGPPGGGAAWDSQSSGSYASSKKSGNSSLNNIPQDVQINSKKLSQFERKIRKRLEKCKSEIIPASTDNPALTTWKAVTSPTHTSSNSGSDQSDGEPVTMWKCIKGSAEEARGEECSGVQRQPRSASLPNMKYTNKLKCVFSMEDGPNNCKSSESASSDYKTCSEEGHRHDEKICSINSKEGCNGEDNSPSTPTKRTSLLELFQKSKSQSGSDSSNISDFYHRSNNMLSPCDTAAGVINDYKEAMVSPNSLRRLTGTWSMSTISSGRRSQCILSPEQEEVPPNVSLKRWGTSQNLPDLSEDLNPDSDQDLLSGSEGDLSVSGHSMASSGRATNNHRVYLNHCNCDLSGCLDCSGQAGSGYMTDSYSTDKQDHSVQWPPCTCNASMQTSLEYPGGNDVNSQKYKLVDTELQTQLKNGNGKPYSSRVSRMYSVPSVKKSSKQARDRLSQSMFSQRSALPDLSFLNNLSVTASGVLRATMSSPNLRQSSTKSCQTSLTEPTSLLARRFPKRSVSTSPCSSRESSPSTHTLRRPRSNSVSTNTSACSSSSSGIDPGYSSCDSQLNKMTHWFGDVPEHLLHQIPEWLVHRIAYSERTLCVVCRVKLLQGALSKDSIASVNSSQLEHDTSHTNTSQSVASSSEVNKKIVKNGNKQQDTVPNKPDVVVSTETVKLRNKTGTHGENKKEERPMSVPDMDLLFDEPVVRRPLKSCLRRNPVDKKRVAMKHRSWSDPFDATVLRYSQDGETRYQLVTNLQNKLCWPADLDSTNNQKPYSSARDSVEFHKTHHIHQQPPSTLSCNNESNIAASNACHCNTSSEECMHGKTSTCLGGTGTVLGGKRNSKYRNSTSPGDVVTNPDANFCSHSNNSSQSHTSSSGISQSDASAETVIEIDHGISEERVGVKISPDKIPVPPCVCGTSHAVLHSSSDSGETSSDLASRHGKKSVKFAEKVFYHSPNNSPHQSPKRQTEKRVALGIGGIERRFPLSRDMLYKIQDISIDHHHNTSAQNQSDCDLGNNSPPPGEFFLSGPSKLSSPSTSTLLELEQQILTQKRALVYDVTRAAELLLLELTKANDMDHLEQLASTRDNANIGHLILKNLCPAIIAIITDDVNQSVRSLFGKVKNTPWRLVEELVEQGNSSRVLCNLVKDLQNLEFLDTTWLKFNAFIFGLLNHRALDFWLTYMCNNEKFIINNYQATSFVSLSQTTARQEFLDMMNSLQPLAKIPFRLEYNFEYKNIKAMENETLSNQLLEKHTTSSVDARLEQLLQHQQQQQQGQGKVLGRQHSADEALSGHNRSSSPLRDSIQGMMSDTIKQYSPAIQHTKERTKTLLMVTGQQIKDKFKQIQRQNKGDDLMYGDATINGVGAKPKSLTPMKVPYSSKGLNSDCDDGKEIRNNQVVINSKTNDDVSDFNKTGVQLTNKELSADNATSKDDTAIVSNTVQEILPRSRSLDIITDTKSRDTVFGDSSTLKRSPKQSSLSDLVNYFGKKLFSFTSATPPPKPPRTYKSGITNYQFEDIKQKDCSDSSSSFSKEVGNKNYHLDDRQSNIDSGSLSTPSLNTEKNNSNNTSDSVCSSQQFEQSNTSSLSSGPPMDFHVSPSDSTTACVTSSISSVDSCSNKLQQQNSDNSFTAAKILSPSANPSNTTNNSDSTVKKTAESISRTANFFKRKFGPTLITVFDKLLLDKRVPTTSGTGIKSTLPSPMPRPKSMHNVKSYGKDGFDGTGEVAVVKRSASAMDFPKRQLKALCTYVATESDELSFNKGSLLSLVKQIDDDWLLCQSHDKNGLVHKGCVEDLIAS